MSNSELFDDVVANLQKAVLDPSKWPRAFALIDKAIGIHGNSTVFGTGDSWNEIRLFFFWHYRDGERQLELEKRYLRDYYANDERVPRLRRLPENKIVHIRDLYTESELKKSPAFNEAMAIAKGQDGFNVRLAAPDDSRIVWSASDPSDAEGWSTAKMELIRGMLPHLRHAIWAHHTLIGAGLLTSTLANLLDATGLGIIQLDGRGRILDVNDRSKKLLLDGTSLFDRNGFLFARGTKNNKKLQKLLSRAIPSSTSIGYGGTAKFDRWPNPPLLVQVHPVQASQAEPRTWSVGALVVINDLPGRPDFDMKLIARTLNLTEMESRVAVMLAKGLSVPVIAKQLGRQESTIRHHIKRMFTKHDLSRQAELINLVRSLAGARNM